MSVSFVLGKWFQNLATDEEFHISGAEGESEMSFPLEPSGCPGPDLNLLISREAEASDFSYNSTLLFTFLQARPMLFLVSLQS